MVLGQMIGRTITKALTIEARQHELFGFDLGDGFRRKEAGLGVLVFLATLPPMGALMWWLGWFQAVPQFAIPIMAAPGLVIVMIGFRPSEANPRRLIMTVVAVTIRYLLIGYRPIVALEAREPSRLERLTLWQRVRPTFAVAVARASQGARRIKGAAVEVDYTGPIEPDVPAQTYTVRQLGYTATRALLEGQPRKGKRHG
ncbi:hypothetical protein [Curtobacterium poinsettiae]|uniref:hypothetical protein n=1 Tax=Curtobacterium poinsettiae TaxID=159612 RepID=UPI001BDF44A2|nr:hypothetical protein [Curtobacterium flaccumfaciens]MBT1611890.1 hypothetical protein [Curtobacterium flaccumfaciens pv. poinsettiae]